MLAEFIDADPVCTIISRTEGRPPVLRHIYLHQIFNVEPHTTFCVSSYNPDFQTKLTVLNQDDNYIYLKQTSWKQTKEIIEDMKIIVVKYQ